MSQLHLSDEVLMAFADGELDEPVAATVAKAMSEDPGVARRVVDFQQSRRLTRSVLSESLESDVPPELHAAVSAQIRAYEAASRVEAKPETALGQMRSARQARRLPFIQMALAASVAALALALGYFLGRQGPMETGSLIAQLESPIVRQELSRSASGQDVELATGRMRVIATYRLENGSLCREFKLQSAASAADAVACRNGEWGVTFAAARPVDKAEYAPSNGGDAVTAYLQDIGAGQPLARPEEARALADASR